MKYYNDVNTRTLQTTRDNYSARYENLSVHKRTAEHLVLLTVLNSLLRVASRTQDLEVIKTLTDAGRIMVEKYEDTYKD